jgi:hypothetical protein
MKRGIVQAVALGSVSLALDRLSIAVLAGVLIHLKTSAELLPGSLPRFGLDDLRNVAIVPVLLGAAAVLALQYATARLARRRIVAAAHGLAERRRAATSSERRAWMEAYAAAIRAATCLATLAVALALLFLFAPDLSIMFSILILAYLVVAAALEGAAGRKALLDPARPMAGRGLGWTRERRHRAHRLDQAAIGIALIAIFATQIDGASVHYSLVVCALVLAKLASVVRSAAGHIRHVAWTRSVMGRAPVSNAASLPTRAVTASAE